MKRDGGDVMAITTSALQILSDQTTQHDEVPREFWELVDTYRSELINQGLAITQDLAEAEDIAQETFNAVYKQPEKLSEVKSLRAWLRAINRTIALNRMRNRRRDSARERRHAEDPSARTFTTGGFTMMEVRETVAKAIDELPERYRAPVLLRYWEELSCAEIAERLGLPEGTVKWRLCEASSRLHEKLKLYFEQQ